MRFAASLFVIALGAILAFGVTTTPSAVNIHVVGLILLLVGLAGLVMGQWLYFSRRRTDIIYRGNRQIWLQPNTPSRGEHWDRVDRPAARDWSAS